jgi:hypothetical protein
LWLIAHWTMLEEGFPTLAQKKRLPEGYPSDESILEFPS